MKAIIAVIAFLIVYSMVDLFAGVVSPILGPLAITLLVAISFYWMFRLARSGR